jgi:3-dehydroquinate synthase
MGTGKTVAGRHAAAALHMPLVDLDEVVELRTGRTVAEAFAAEGEAGFREKERRAMLDAARLSAAVVCAGGGAVLDEAAFADLARDSVVAVLTCDPENLIARLGDGAARPLLQPDPAAAVRALLAQRADRYRALGDAIDTTRLTPEEAGARLADRYRARVDGRLEVLVPGPSGPYPVEVGDGALEGLGRSVRRVAPRAGRAALVVDAGARDWAGGRAARALEDEGLPVLRIVARAGEPSKSLDVIVELWTRFHESGLEPSDVVVAVGGGAVLDAAGFAAATFDRGMALVNVPTTLLAMVDASLGGKVGIDFAGMKNKVGTFHHPALVVADPSTLRTLDPRTIRAGLAECVKAAVLASPLALDVLGWSTESTDESAPANLVWIIEQAIRIKAAYVGSDPRDGGLRHSLNLGHTFAHAVEAASGYAVPHGEAVAMGLVAAARLGARAGVTDPQLEPELRRLLSRLGLPTRPPSDLDRPRLLGAMRADKKRRSGRDAFVVPAPGGAELIQGDLAADAIEALMPDPVGVTPAGGEPER